MALGIHVDTGSLTYHHTTVRDAHALAWLMEQGANQSAVAEFAVPRLSAQVQAWVTTALANLQTEEVQGYQISSVLLQTEDYLPGLSSLASHLMDLLPTDCLFLGHAYRHNHLAVIGRARGKINLANLFKAWSGGGHAHAAALTLKTDTPAAVLAQLRQHLRDQLPPLVTAERLMSAPVRTIRPDTSIDQARKILLRYGHSGLSVVDTTGNLVGILSRRDLDIALHHGFGHAPVKGYMSAPVRTIQPDTSLAEIQTLMVTYDIGRLPVLVNNQLVGIVTRTDVLRQLYPLEPTPTSMPASLPESHAWRKNWQTYLPAPLQQLLTQVTAVTMAHGWQVYLVGGAVRDLLLAPSPADYRPHEFDFVVDGVQDFPPEGPGVVIAQALQQQDPPAQLQVYGQFQTAALHWPTEAALSGFTIDIATARTEFYPYPAAHPEVTASSIRQDLYRRDFTINALAIRLTPPQPGELLDFFGGRQDLSQRHVRVLHPNSFIEDPTRIFRAVRFAVRLGFQIEPQTEAYIRHAIASGSYPALTNGVKLPSLQSRLRNELKYLLQADYWQPALELLTDLGALQCLHPSLIPDAELWRRMHLAARWWQHFTGSRAAQASTDEPANETAKTVNKSWEMMLETLLAELPAELRQPVAANLNLGQQSETRLQTLAAACEHLPQAVVNQPPSQVYQTLQPYDVAMLILVASRSRAPVRQQIWRYLSQWRQVKPLLNGRQLQELGYPRGPILRQILDRLQAATLDGEVTDTEQAKAILAREFPL
jgi:tRNA nucleotidyltransferase (CCA-adding enzyme)